MAESKEKFIKYVIPKDTKRYIIGKSDGSLYHCDTPNGKYEKIEENKR